MERLKSTQKQILEIVEGYNTLPQDFSDIERLLNAQKKLSTLSLRYAVEVGVHKKRAEELNFIRKYKFAKAVEKHIEDGIKSVARAENKARLDVYEEEKEEVMNLSLYNGMKLFLNQVNEVLDGLRQRISYLKQEKSFSNFVDHERMDDRVGGGARVPE